MKIHPTSAGSTIVTGLFGVITILVIAMVAYLIYTDTHHAIIQGSSSSTPGSSQPATYILPPASVPPKINECQQHLTYAANGNPSPIQCSNGALNVLAWNALAAQEPSVMKLGYQASQAQVQAAICKDANAADADSSAIISAPLESTAYHLAALYYGWNLSIDPTAIITHC